MSDDMIERVKAAIAEKFAPAINFNAPYAKVMIDAAARAAIEAMREPTEAMLKEGFAEGKWECSFGVNGESAELSSDAPGIIWEAMIDAALAEPKP